MGFLSALVDLLLALKFPGITGTIAPPSGVPTGGLFTTGQDAIRAGLSFFLIIVLLLALLYAFLGAIRYIFSRGDKEKIKGAREKITYSIVGLIVAFLAFLLVGLASRFLNVPLIATLPPGPTPSCIKEGSICDFEFGTIPCCSPSVCTLGNLCVSPTPTKTLFVTVTAAPVSSLSPLKSFIGFSLRGTATGFWKATLRCEGAWTEELNDSSPGGAFSTPCTFTIVAKHDVDVDVTRDGLTTTATVIVEVRAGPTSTPTPTGGGPAPTPTLVLSGCLDRTTDQDFGTTPGGGKKVHGCNGSVSYASAGSLCADGWHTGDLVSDSGLVSLLASIPATSGRWVRMDGDPGGVTGTGVGALCFRSPLAPACTPDPSPGTRPLHYNSSTINVYLSGSLVASSKIDYYDGTAGTICVQGN